MIYETKHSGVSKIKYGESNRHGLTIAYRVKGVTKEATVNYLKLPKELQLELAEVTNKIARCIEEG